MKAQYIVIFIIFCFLHSCKDKNGGFNISLHSENKLDTIYVSELITGNNIVQLNEKKKNQIIQLKNPTVAEIHDKDKGNIYLTILAKNKDLNISIKPSTNITTNNKSDSLINYLWKSNLAFISENSSFIFQTENVDSIPIIFEKFRKKRADEITQSKNEFTSDVADILYFQNDARIYSFLFYFGRVAKELDPNNSYFDFIGKIPKANQTLKSLPDIYLYKYEVEYLRKNQSIESIADFLKFIEHNVGDKDLADFLKANYLKALIENPSYWQKHEKIFNTEVLSEVLKSEKNNLYQSLIEKSSSNFYASQNGQSAYLFDAEDRMGNNFNLEFSLGKVIFIDVWATWCGPCINHRPKVLQFAEKFAGRDDIEILLISVDSSKEKWLSFLGKENKYLGKNLFIENGMRTDFGNRYNIKSIPRYILIGKDGNIINSNLNEPSLAVEKEIEKALSIK